MPFLNFGFEVDQSVLKIIAAFLIIFIAISSIVFFTSKSLAVASNSQFCLNAFKIIEIAESFKLDNNRYPDVIEINELIKNSLGGNVYNPYSKGNLQIKASKPVKKGDIQYITLNQGQLFYINTMPECPYSDNLKYKNDIIMYKVVSVGSYGGEIIPQTALVNKDGMLKIKIQPYENYKPAIAIVNGKVININDDNTILLTDVSTDTVIYVKFEKVNN